MKKQNLYARTLDNLAELDEKHTRGTSEYSDAIQSLIALNLAFIGDRLLALEGLSVCQQGLSIKGSPLDQIQGKP